MLKLFIFFCFLVSSNSIGAAAEEGVVDNPVLSIDRPDPVQIQENNKGETVIGTSKTLERNLIYSKDIIKNDSDIVITKGAWNVDDSKVIEGFTTKKITVSKEVRKTDNDVVSHKNRAYIALQQRHYEIAVYYYKEILKNNKNDVYAKLGLATAYQ
ncbi:MAG: hypothetical protein LBH46_01205 [Rickettsiales bacterium]|nr:hypothetical protein [Rickettsiales bacterium]